MGPCPSQLRGDAPQKGMSPPRAWVPHGNPAAPSPVPSVGGLRRLGGDWWRLGVIRGQVGVTDEQLGGDWGAAVKLQERIQWATGSNWSAAGSN